jgi:hypothetical protein
MSKGSKKSGKSKSRVRIADLEAMALVAPTPRGLKKQLRRLERQLVEAAQVESKRLRKLERARNRRQVAEAALAFVLSEGPVLDEAAKPVPQKAVAAAPAEPVAKPQPAPKAAAVKRTPAAAKPAATRPAAAKLAAPRRTAARTKPATAKPPVEPKSTED